VEEGQFTTGERDGPGNQRNMAKEKIVRKVSSPGGIARECALSLQ